MRRFLPITTIFALSALAMLAALPGCDELVTDEVYYYDTLRIDGTNFETDSTCFGCHNDETDSIRIALRQWDYSRHATTGLLDYDYLGNNTSDCGPQCHTKEGFVTYLAEGTRDEVFYATEIGCFACHAPHTNRDFTLRTTLDELCVTCHSQTIDPPSSGLTNVFITEDWGPHFSTELGMLLGTGGYEFNGYTYTSSAHANLGASGCVYCHMDTANGFTLGGHSFNIRFGTKQLVEGCNVANCHDYDPVSGITNYSMLQLELLDSLDVLRDSLISAGLLQVSNIPVERTLNGLNLVSDSAGALFNYLFVSADSSWGVHNLPYAVELVNSSIAFLADQYTVTIDISPAETGTVSLSPVGGSYLGGTEVTLTPTPAEGYIFDSWSGDLTGSDDPATITMDADKAITANFISITK